MLEQTQGALHFRAPGWVCQAKAVSLGSPAELAKLTFATAGIKGQDWDWLTLLMGMAELEQGAGRRPWRVGYTVLLPSEEGEIAEMGAGTVVCTLPFQLPKL